MSGKRDNKEDMEWYDQHHREHMKNWRAWGSWFSWGSPIGLGLFYALIVLSSAGAIWIYHHR